MRIRPLASGRGKIEGRGPVRQNRRPILPSYIGDRGLPCPVIANVGDAVPQCRHGVTWGITAIQYRVAMRLGILVFCQGDDSIEPARPDAGRGIARTKQGHLDAQRVRRGKCGFRVGEAQKDYGFAVSLQPSFPIATAVSDIRLEKPHSLSYQDRTRTKVPSTTWVCVKSKVELA